MALKRGDIVTITPAGDFNKPRPAVVLQNFSPAGMETVTIVPLTSDLKRLPSIRVPVAPTPQNGLRTPSEIMTDNVQTILRRRIGQIIGHLEEDVVQLMAESVGVFLGLR